MGLITLIIWGVTLIHNIHFNKELYFFFDQKKCFIPMKRKKREYKTLLCVIQALIGYNVTIELRSGTTIKGKVEDVDNLMK